MFSGFNDGDWSQLIYLSLLLAYLASSMIFKSHLKTSTLLKQFMAWVGIALVVLIGYSFRHEFSDLKNRIMAELFPSRVVRVSSNQISIRLAEDGHFHMDLKINGVLVKFLVDTGASDVALSMQDAKRVGIDVNNLNFDKLYYTANGKTFGATVNLARVEIGDMVMHDIAASVNQGNLSNSLLGMSFLQKFKRYEFSQDRLILTY